MSGHNKWSKIKRQKAGTDAAKSKMFGKLARMISVAAKQGNGLEQVVEKARDFGMPKENIERAIKKASEANTEHLESITYEAYGPGGSALVIEALTTNRNKAAQEVKFILSKHGFQLAAPGSATWAFTKEHQEWIPKQAVPVSEEDGKILEKLIEELEDNDEVQEVFTNAE